MGLAWRGPDQSPESLFLSSQIISQTWPYLSMIMENKFREKLEPKIRAKSVHLRTFTFTKLYFGQKVSAVTERAAWVCCAPVTHLTEWDPPGLVGGPAPTYTSQPLGLRTEPSPCLQALREPGSERTKKRGGKQFHFS